MGSGDVFQTPDSGTPLVRRFLSPKTPIWKTSPLASFWDPQISPAERIPAGSPIDVPTEVVDTFATIWEEESALMTAARTLHDAEYPEHPEVITYTVRRGDTLAAIAGRHRSSVSELSQLNGIRPPNYVIQPGQQLIVPPGS